MGSLVTAKIIAASAGLQALLEAAAWEGRIVGVFHSSLLCATSDGRLLHLHAGPPLVSPFSARIGGEFTRVLQQIPLAQGMPVRKLGSGIDIAERLHLRLDDVTYYGSARHVGCEVRPEAVEIARQTFGSHRRSGGFDSLPGAQTIVTTMQRALVNGHSGQFLEAARRLIGLGPGLTPAGDDFLVGCLRGVWLIHPMWKAAPRMLDRLRADLFPSLDRRTTRVGAEFIRYAVDGAFAEVLDQAAEALVSSAYPRLVQLALGKLLAQGETSGTDTTLGLLICVEAMLSNAHREARSQWGDASSVPSTYGTP